MFLGFSLCICISISAVSSKIVNYGSLISFNDSHIHIPRTVPFLSAFRNYGYLASQCLVRQSCKPIGRISFTDSSGCTYLRFASERLNPCPCAPSIRRSPTRIPCHCSPRLPCYVSHRTTQMFAHIHLPRRIRDPEYFSRNLVYIPILSQAFPDGCAHPPPIISPHLTQVREIPGSAHFPLLGPRTYPIFR